MCYSSLHVVHPWTKNTCRHRDPFASECIQMFNALYINEHRWIRTHACKHTWMYTDADTCRRGHKPMQWANSQRCMQTHADTNVHMQMQTDVARQTQSKRCSVSGWTQPQDVSGWTFLQGFGMYYSNYRSSAIWWGGWIVWGGGESAETTYCIYANPI